jgi:hypothetical protein
MSGHVGFMVVKVTLGQVFCEYSGFPCHHFTICSTLIIIHHPGLVQ